MEHLCLYRFYTHTHNVFLKCLVYKLFGYVSHLVASHFNIGTPLTYI